MKYTLFNKCYAIFFIFLTFFIIASQNVTLAEQLSSGGSGSKQEEGQTKKTNQGTSFYQLWSERNQVLSRLQAESTHIQSEIEQKANNFEGIVKAEQKEFNELFGLYQVAYDRPIEQMSLAYRMQRLSTRLNKTFEPFKALLLLNSNGVSEVERLKKELSDSISDGFVAVGNTDLKEKNTIEEYQKTLARTNSILQKTASSLSKNFVPVQNTLKLTNETITNIHSSLQATWIRYYFTQTYLSQANFFLTPAIILNWVKGVTTSAILSTPQSSSEWSYVAKQVSIIFLVLLCLGIWGYKKVTLFSSKDQVVIRDITKKSCSWIALGLSFLIASAGEYSGIYLSFVFLGGTIFLWGISTLSWRLQIWRSEGSQGKLSPYAFLFLPAVLGIFFLYTEMPIEALGVIWLGLMILSWYSILLLERKVKSNTSSFSSSFLYSFSKYFALLSFVVSIIGFSRLAILLFLFLFIVAIFISLLLGSWALLIKVVDKVFDKETMSVRNAMMHTLVFPFAFLFALIGMLPSQWVVPGGRYLFQEALTVNYSIGGASFAFSHLINIAVLFFIFRLVITLGKTALLQLPDKLPNIETGVIPPLRTLLVYSAWTLFAVVSMGILGVSLTNIAVVAGGLSVGIGFGLQHIFNNLVSGLLLIFGRSILIGDVIQVGTVIGTVKDISIRCTTVETLDMALVYIPNSMLTSAQFTNNTRNHRRVQRNFQFSVAIETDITLVKQLVTEVIEKHERTVKLQPPKIRFESFGNGLLDFTVFVVIEDISFALDTLSDIKADLISLLREHNIAIPAKQFDVHISEAILNKSINEEKS